MPDWDRLHPHTRLISVTPEHIDLMHHVNNIHYLSWALDVAWDHSRSLGMAPEDYTRLGHGMVARRHELDYVRPARLHDRIQLATWIVELDGLSLHRRYQFVHADSGETLFRGSSHFVCVEIRSGRPRRMPAEFQAAYARGLSATAA